MPDLCARRGIRHQLVVGVTAAVCAVVAGYRSYTAIGEWVADLPATITADHGGGIADLVVERHRAALGAAGIGGQQWAVRPVVGGGVVVRRLAGAASPASSAAGG
ncbi:hypothetical protein AB0M46_12635 [Dactylosporangium sp. NPDC051485]|uniref:hypothetical protein n=1 Tax=Dactylosporangium sp. NPDC051485 TaxID=3154846 RepID=UPI00342E13EC